MAEHNDSDDSRSVSQRQKEIKGRNIFIKICACPERNKRGRKMNRLYVPAHSFRILSFVLQLFSESSIGFGCLAEEF